MGHARHLIISVKAPKKPHQPVQETEEAIAALALNEQGFLFQQRVLETLEGATDAQSDWMVRAVEYPVSFGLPGSFETKIDMILGGRGSNRDPWHLVVECKRANRDYKRWIFFDQKIRLNGLSHTSMFLQRADLSGGWDHSSQPLPPLTQRVEKLYAHSDCPIFNFYIEARINRPNSGQRASATEAIEDSLRQVCTGLVGLAVDLRRMKSTSHRLMPIVVTSADLMSAEFNTAKVSVERGHILPENLTLKPQKWLAVNYRIDESVAQFAGLTTNTPSNVSEALWTQYIRTVFVVQAEHLLPFLKWAHYWITDA